MCGVIGVYADNSEEVIHYIKRLFEESQIRGKHATGLSYVKDSKIETKISPVGSKEFISRFNLSVLPEQIRLIGHSRYSTSDLEYNQPISNENVSIVHNGVITQKDPSLWEKDFGYVCKTRNDSELILKCLEEGKEPLEEFPKSSMSAICISKEDFYFFRNGTRPLWYIDFRGGYFVSSTRDILLKVFGKTIHPIKCISGIVYDIIDGSLFDSLPLLKEPDNQVDLPCSDYYSKVVL